MKRILHVVYKMNRGGIETFVMNLYRAIDKSQYQFDFLVHTHERCDFDDEIKSLGGNIYHLSKRGDGYFKYVHTLDEFFKTHHSDYVAVHQHVSSLTSIEPLIYAKKYGISIRIIHSHSSSTKGGRVHKLFHKINKYRINRIATNFFACSNSAALWNFNVTNTDIKIINNGIDTSVFCFDESKRNLLRKSLNLDNKTVIGHVGRFSTVKNHKFLIDVFNEYLKTNSTAILLLIGNGDLMEDIKQKVINLNIEDNVIFLGLRDDVYNLYNVMDLFILPSLYEGLPLVSVEAECNGLNVVCSDTISKSININHKVQFCSLSDNIHNWVDAISIGIADKNDRRNAYKNVIEEGYDISSIARMFENEIYSN